MSEMAVSQLARNQPQALGLSDDDIVQGTCDIVAKAGSLSKAARRFNMSPRGLWHLIASKREYGDAYAMARATRAQYHEGKITDGAKHLAEIRKSSFDHDVQVRAITQEVKTRQWLAKVSDPHMFGDKRQITSDGSLSIEHSLSPNEHARRIAFMLMQAAVQPGAKK